MYTYSGGNLGSIRRTNGSGVSHPHTYTYGDSEWKDLLTAYDGESITYDTIGNPTSYYNGNRWTFGWENGRQLTSLSKQPPVVITTQPENYYGTVGGTATFTVAASGDRVSYQWQCSTDDGETWSNVTDGTSATLSVSIQASVNGYLYRCIAKDYMGHAATSQAGRLTVTSALSAISEFDPEFTIINEPDDYYGRPGDTATFIVEAEGANLSYQWLCRAPGANNFEYLTSSDATTNTLRVEMTAQSAGAEYRCFITDANGDMGSTRIATVKLDVRDWEMEYNTSGIRTKRISDEKTYSYVYAGDKLMRMTVGSDTLDFSYDANGVPLTMTHNGTVYYYITNLQGDVMRVQSGSGNTVAQYAYDAWGNIIAIMGTLAELNPLRYRGYVYDQETGFYYLNSRYYDPEIGRFINPDAAIGQVGNIKGNNMFTYALNNPIMYSDLTGNWPKLSTVLAGVAAVAATVAVAAAVVATCGAAIPAVAAGGSLALGLSAGSAASAIATTALAVAGATAIASATSYALEKIAADTSKNDNSVYVLVDEGGTVQYVGRTKNVERRREAHSQNPARSGLRMDVIASGLNHSESRALEQAGMAYYHTINTADKMNNQINSIAPQYWGGIQRVSKGCAGLRMESDDK